MMLRYRRSCDEPDRRHHQIEQFAGAPDERQALEVLLAARRLADEHHARLRIAVGEDELFGHGAQRAAFEFRQDSRSSARLAALRAASRAAMTAMSGAAGAAPARFASGRAAGAILGRMSAARAGARSGACSPMVSGARSICANRQPVKRHFADQRIDAGLGVEIEQSARRIDAVRCHEAVRMFRLVNAVLAEAARIRIVGVAAINEFAGEWHRILSNRVAWSLP